MAFYSCFVCHINTVYDVPPTPKILMLNHYSLFKDDYEIKVDIVNNKTIVYGDEKVRYMTLDNAIKIDDMDSLIEKVERLLLLK
jgi:hypothetical protein